MIENFQISEKLHMMILVIFSLCSIRFFFFGFYDLLTNSNVAINKYIFHILFHYIYLALEKWSLLFFDVCVTVSRRILFNSLLLHSPTFTPFAPSPLLFKILAKQKNLREKAVRESLLSAYQPTASVPLISYQSLSNCLKHSSRKKKKLSKGKRYF